MNFESFLLSLDKTDFAGKTGHAIFFDLKIIKWTKKI